MSFLDSGQGKIFSIIAALELERNDVLPEWVCFFHEGNNEVDGYGQFVVNRSAWELLKTKLNIRGIDIVIDYEHQTLKDIPAPAAGWCKKWRYTDGVGIEARVDWTETAASYILKGEYRYFSPVFHVRESDSLLVSVHSVALTNTPRTNHLRPILAKLEGEFEKQIADPWITEEILHCAQLLDVSIEDLKIFGPLKISKV